MLMAEANSESNGTMLSLGGATSSAQYQSTLKALGLTKTLQYGQQQHAQQSVEAKRSTSIGASQAQVAMQGKVSQLQADLNQWATDLFGKNGPADLGKIGGYLSQLVGPLGSVTGLFVDLATVKIGKTILGKILGLGGKGGGVAAGDAAGDAAAAAETSASITAADIAGGVVIPLIVAAVADYVLDHTLPKRAKTDAWNWSNDAIGTIMPNNKIGYTPPEWAKDLGRWSWTDTTGKVGGIADSAWHDIFGGGSKHQSASGPITFKNGAIQINITGDADAQKIAAELKAAMTHELNNHTMVTR
jgi:hypothetical protein